MMRPRFEYGQSVRVIKDLRNDGTYPGVGTGKLLAARGSVGHVRGVGVFLQDQIIYSVDFLDVGRVIGCPESELIAAEAAWCSARFRPGDRVGARISLAVGGSVVVGPGTIGEVQAIVETGEGDTVYRVAFGKRSFHVREGALEALRCTFAIDPLTSSPA